MSFSSTRHPGPGMQHQHAAPSSQGPMWRHAGRMSAQAAAGIPGLLLWLLSAAVCCLFLASSCGALVNWGDAAHPAHPFANELPVLAVASTMPVRIALHRTLPMRVGEHVQGQRLSEFELAKEAILEISCCKKLLVAWSRLTQFICTELFQLVSE
jgi:hypothetical protein